MRIDVVMCLCYSDYSDLVASVGVSIVFTEPPMRSDTSSIAVLPSSCDPLVDVPCAPISPLPSPAVAVHRRLSAVSMSPFAL